MAKRNRASLLKRQREAEKRERQAKRAAKTAAKRERRVQKRSAESQIAPDEDVADDTASPDLSTVAADIDHDVPVGDPGANAYGTTASESG
jgi:hypothetical protein